MLLWVLLVTAVAGTVLVIKGRYGKRINEHPICQKCGFDLEGLFYRSSESKPCQECPECGSRLHFVNAVVIGRRSPRWKMVYLGASLLALGVVSIALMIVSRTTQPRWLNFVSSPALVWLLECDWPVGQEEVLDELAARWHSHKDDISAGSDAERGFLKQILRVQSDKARRWNLDWGWVVESMHKRGGVDDQSWLKYAKTAMDHRFVARTRVKQGGIWSIGTSITTPCRRAQSNLDAYLKFSPARAAGTELSFSTAESQRVWEGNGIFLFDGAQWFTRGYHVTLAPGRYKIETDASFRLVASRSSSENESLGEWIEPLEFELEVVATDPANVELVDDEVVQARLRAAIWCESADPNVHALEMNERLRNNGSSEWRILAHLRARDIPVACAFTVAFRWDGKEVSGDGGAIFLTGSSLQLALVTATFEGQPPKFVDLVFRPDIAAAEAKPEISAIWGKEFVINDVPVVAHSLDR